MVILFSTLISSGEVIAFAPHTLNSTLLRLKHDENRWKKQLYNTYIANLFKRRIWDLKILLHESVIEHKIYIYVSKLSRLDLIHEPHLKDIQDVTMHEFENGGHGIVKLLSEEGKLPKISPGNYA